MTAPSTNPKRRESRRVPASTYRLQLSAAFPFADAASVLPYLAALGITDCYVSPPFTARPGSTHGYDVVNHGELNPDLGGAAGFGALAHQLAGRGMGCVVDFVPNHMSNDPGTNGWWRDVLENGPSSPFAGYFDIDWQPVKPELKDRLLLPVLGEPYGEALEGGRLQVVYREGGLVLRHGGHELPLNPRSTPRVYEIGLEALAVRLGEANPDLREFLSVLTALRNLPPYTERDARRIAERQREKEVARGRLAALVEASAAIRGHIDAAIRTVNGVVGRPDTFMALHGVLEMQAYRLASWRTGFEEINYRRFFDVNDLVGMRVEDAAVFSALHERLLELVRDGCVTGVRLDHIDGLADPAAYLVRLSGALAAATGSPAGAAPFYVVVEKILSSGEVLRDDWRTDGTTGYDFLNDVNGLFIDRRAAGRLWRAYVRLTHRDEPFADIVYDSRQVIVTTAMASEFQVLVSAANRISEQDWWSRDFTMGSIRRALRAVLACFPVYRTYVRDGQVTSADREVVDSAILAARQRNPAVEPSIFGFLRALLLPEPPAEPGAAAAERYRQRLDVAFKAQQCTAPIQAKGLEDTAFYRYNLLLSLNEVGGDPRRFGRSVAEFHAANTHRRSRWPAGLLATATHDTKRGEDARARLNVLSELPAEWRAGVVRWTRITAPVRRTAGTDVAPDPNDAYHLYQMLLATWPPEPEDAPVPARAPADLVGRLSAYMTKAIREAKVHTSWVSVNEAYEAAVEAFVDGVLAGEVAAPFLASFVPFARRVARIGAANSLAQLVLKVVSPGVADFYQGSEWWDLSLVDPDNRRPVDFAARARMLAELEPLLAAAGRDDGTAAPGVGRLLETWWDARAKLLVTACLLRYRRAHADLLLQGEYLPLAARGKRAAHVVAAARRLSSDAVIAVVPRLTAGFDRNGRQFPTGRRPWQDTTVSLPADFAGRVFRNVITGERVVPGGGPGAQVAVAEILATSPVALLAAEPDDGARPSA